MCDLLGPRELIRQHFKGAYAVVHSGFVPPPKDVSIQASSFLAANLSDERMSDEDKAKAAAATELRPADRLFAAEHSNVQMAFNVYQTAVEEVRATQCNAVPCRAVHRWPARPPASPSPGATAAVPASHRTRHTHSALPSPAHPRRQGVKRVVVSSSNHAADFY
eukprot:SAG22_NODE_8794_length_629_cov_1.096226_1_plen_163_part_01